MNKRGFIDFDDVNPISLLFGAIGLSITMIIGKRMGTGMIMTIISAIIVAGVCFYMGQKMSE